ncbi:hypothetical protein EDC04DRAFT_2712789 [Pisolithus marmoratus]|nr:hypothetical protein EDC04DRAFT_2712789 [Pisolithus marmoratus]
MRPSMNEMDDIAVCHITSYLSHLAGVVHTLTSPLMNSMSEAYVYIFHHRTRPWFCGWSWRNPKIYGDRVQRAESILYIHGMDDFLRLDNCRFKIDMPIHHSFDTLPPIDDLGGPTKMPEIVEAVYKSGSVRDHYCNGNTAPSCMS